MLHDFVAASGNHITVILAVSVCTVVLIVQAVLSCPLGLSLVMAFLLCLCMLQNGLPIGRTK